MISSDHLTAIRALFPYTGGRRIYLNHAGTSPLSIRVVAAVEKHLRERSEGALDTYRTDLEMTARLRAAIASLINAESPRRISLQPSTSEALNVVAAGLPWKQGDRVILNDQEFPANVYPYLNLRQRGVELDIVPSHNGAVHPADIEAAITPHTRSVAISAVQFLSGHRTDLAAVGDLCRRRGIHLLVDGIQAVGAVRIDVQRMKIDALAAGAQKWQMGPHGSGFLYLTEDLQSRIHQQYLGWIAVEDPMDFRNYGQPLAASARRYEIGSLNFPSLWGMSAAVDLLGEVGAREIEEQILDHTEILTRGLAGLPGLRLISPTSRSDRAGIVTVEATPPVDALKLFNLLHQSGVTAALREGKIRYSPHFYNSAEEIENAAESTRECLSKL